MVGALTSNAALALVLPVNGLECSSRTLPLKQRGTLVCCGPSLGVQRKAGDGTEERFGETQILKW